MDFSLSPEMKAFQDEVHQFFLGEEACARGAKEEWDGGQGFGAYSWEVLRKIGAKGWLCPMWPRKYGGLELSFMYRYIIMEQMHHFLGWISTVGAGMAGPVILSRGSDQQKEKYLPGIAAGEFEFALGYTEPEAGSDLASLSLEAVEQGDHFVLNGSKLFNTRCHFAQYYWLGARTADTVPLYKGISLFIVDLDSPGLTINPVWTVGGRRTNEVHFNNVSVPKANLVGEINKGFYYIMEAVDWERICTVGGLKRDFSSILKYLKDKKLLDNPAYRQKYAEIAIEIEAARLLALRTAWMLDKGTIPNYEAAMLKMVVSEVEQDLINTTMQLLGHYGELRKGVAEAPLDGFIEHKYRDSLEELVTRGTSEIMKNIIAQRGLKLPRK